MAEGKKSFVLYSDLLHTIGKLPDQKAGELFKLILNYVNDNNPETDDLILQIAFEPIKQQLKRDLEKWDDKRIVRSESGRTGGIKSGETRRKQKEANEANALKSKQIEANEAVSVNVNVNVIYKDILDLFKSITGKDLKLNESRKKLINGRISEGYGLEDFKKVIEIKHTEWSKDLKMKQYLTPETLFAGSNFTKYREQVQEIRPASTMREGASKALNGLVY